MISNQGVIGFGGSGTVTVTGTDGNGHASTWAATDNIYVGLYGNGTLTVADGGVVSTSGDGGGAASIYIGYAGGTTGVATVSSSTADVSTLTASDQIDVGVDGTGTLTIEKGGYVTADNTVYVASGAGSGTLNLLGDASGRGVLETGQVVSGGGAAVLNLDGGILRANTDDSDFLSGFTALTVGSDGAWFDTNGYAVGVGTAFSGSSSFTKQGLGTLTLTGDSSAFAGTTTITAGTLQLGDGGTTGAIGGTVTDNATLAFDRSDAVTFGGTISGSGAVSQIGTGSTTLTGVNTYGGGTMITAGSLIGSATSFGSGAIADNAALIIDQATDADFANAINGTGSFTKQGLGTLALTGDSSAFTGTTTITAGTLQIGDGGTTGAIGGNVTDNATLAFDRSDAVTFGGTISGSGAVSQIGTGNTTLTAVNTYAGGTTIAADSLIGSATSFGSGAIADNAALIIDQAMDADFANSINGSGSFTKQGLGTLALTGDSSAFAGTTTITAGTLQIGDGGTTGNLGGAVTDNATLAFDRSDAMTFGAAISGSGAVSQIGTGNTTLTAVNTYAGGTTISGGILIGSATSFGSGAIADNAALIIDQATDAGFANAINGTGSFTKQGLGTLTLTAVNTYSGGTAITAGSLIGSATSFGSGAIADNAALIINQATDAGFANVINGSGSFTKQGLGTLALTGDSSAFTGTTTITAGTLQLGDGGTTGNLGGTVTDNATLAFDRSDAMTFGAAISGSGAVSQIGTGSTTLTAVNTYAGGTTITAGSLIGSATSFGSGAIADNAALIINQATDAAFANVINGSGSFAKQGLGTLTLTAVNTYAGGTTITAGSLIGSATSFGSGAIADNAALIINQATDAGFANPINGSGSFTKQGAGRLNYTGTGSLSGPTTVAAGLLSVNGSLMNSAVTVASGATLGGNGTVGATTVLAGGTMAPGNSIGTLHVNGAYTQMAGSTYQVQVDPNSSASDLVLVNGAASLTTGAGLSVSKADPGDYKVGTIYTIVTATNGVTGTYTLAGDTAVSPYLSLKDSYDADHVYLSVIKTGDPADAATTPNQTQTATGTDSLPDNSGVGSGILNTSDPDATRSAFDQLSGEALASAKSALISGSLLLRDTAIDRLRDVLCTDDSDETRRADDRAHAACSPRSDEPALWAQGFGNWGHISGDGNAAALSDSTAGVLVGADLPVYDWRVGYFGGYSRTDFSVEARSSSGRSDDYHLGLYGGRQWGDLGLRVGASYSWHSLVTDRSVVVGSLSNNLRADYDAGTTQLFGELGQRFTFGALAIEPFANMAYVNLRTGGFSETGGDAALTAKADTMESTFATFGVRPSIDISLWDFNATARGMAGWRHTFGDVTPSSVVSFAGSDTFTVAGVPIARDAGVVEAGLDFTVHKNVVAGITYGGQFSDREIDHSIRGTVSISF